jgi:hypothetical protein
MSIYRLQQLAEDFGSVPADEFEDIAQACWAAAIQHLDVRYMVLRDCLRLSRALYTDGDVGFMSNKFYRAMAATWSQYLRPIIEESSEEAATVQACALLEELECWAIPTR